MMGQGTISILGMGWLGLPLGARLVERGYVVQGSTTRVEQFAAIKEAGAIPHLINADPQLLVSENEDFFRSDILIITLPPSSISPGGRRGQSEPDGRFAETMQRFIADTTIRPGYVVYTSSISVYGNVVGEVDELTNLNPRTSSAKAVLQAEDIIRATYPNKSAILRLGGLIGGGRQPGRFLAGRKEVPNGNAPINLVHREDCIRAIMEIIEKDGWGQVFNLVAPQHPLKRDFYPVVTARAGLTPPQFDAADLSSGKSVLSKKIEKVLGFTFQYPDPRTFPD